MIGLGPHNIRLAGGFRGDDDGIEEQVRTAMYRKVSSFTKLPCGGCRLPLHLAMKALSENGA